MTVREMIEALSKLPPDYTVMYQGCKSACVADVEVERVAAEPDWEDHNEVWIT